MDSLDLLKKRLFYQSHHRGTREMDLLLGKFAREYLPAMGQEETEKFEALLELSDQELYEWLCKSSLLYSC